MKQEIRQKVEKAGGTNAESLRLHTHGSVGLEMASGGQMAGAEAAEALVVSAGDFMNEAELDPSRRDSASPGEGQACLTAITAKLVSRRRRKMFKAY